MCRAWVCCVWFRRLVEAWMCRDLVCCVGYRWLGGAKMCRTMFWCRGLGGQVGLGCVELGFAVQGLGGQLGLECVGLCFDVGFRCYQGVRYGQIVQEFDLLCRVYGLGCRSRWLGCIGLGFRGQVLRGQAMYVLMGILGHVRKFTGFTEVKNE